ncbi:hypothetical protein EMIHUDRAFT_221786 [Emiliania huxleyi CCMP1516]|uniref:Uncharacterized protein n=2 Tax=Emiliania huxleyi TaxID=2903 RepID=A0A0D3HY77_EMIH1|nr:hypothetical protein EMIHUDRAFT_221786 [Emiliania huxleyi CCMP1516]EOD03962.1 hypothetical protein EMIHUDRAFT_221786 [Emiliania huxleyi CCMP1516]|eukprot:XP_005756391.1 hypothetical protein EMIHUDRAFT_221786 [Emiliania huxleyi CCMP1516]
MRDHEPVTVKSCSVVLVATSASARPAEVTLALERDVTKHVPFSFYFCVFSKITFTYNRDQASQAPACAELIAGEGWAKRSAAAAYPLGALR